MTELVLASSSLVRAQLLAASGAAFSVVPARIDEDAVKSSLLAEGIQPREIADALAELKALRVSASRPETLVLGADQVLEFEDRLVSKSSSAAEAKALLQSLRGGKHALHTAAVLAKNGSVVWRHLSHAELWMRPFSDEFLDDYLLKEADAALNSVGCFRFEGRGAQLFSRVEGDYFSILGLPLLPVLAALRERDAIAK